MRYGGRDPPFAVWYPGRSLKTENLFLSKELTMYWSMLLCLQVYPKNAKSEPCELKFLSLDNICALGVSPAFDTTIYVTCWVYPHKTLLQKWETGINNILFSQSFIQVGVNITMLKTLQTTHFSLTIKLSNIKYLEDRIRTDFSNTNKKKQWCLWVLQNILVSFFFGILLYIN